MDMTLIINQMVQLFIIIALGYLLFRIGLFDEGLNKKLTSLLLHVTTPALILHSVLANQNTGDGSLARITLIFIGIFVVVPLVGWLISLALGAPKEQRGLYMFMTTYGNAGFMGFPVVNAVLGAAGVFYAAIFNLVFNLFLYSVGLLQFHVGLPRQAKLNWKKLLSPCVIASLLALVCYLCRWTAPAALVDLTDMLGSITTPLAMLLIGSTLATMPLKAVVSDLRADVYAVIRQVFLPVLFLPVLRLLLTDDFLLAVTFLMVSMPVANVTLLFALEYGGDQQLAAKNIFLTTLLSVVTIPLSIYLFLL